MAKRWLPRGSFGFRIDGVRYSFNPGYVHSDGLPGYPKLPKGMNKMQRASFYEVGKAIAESEDPPVEAATQAPGQKRSTKIPKPSVTVE